MQSHSCEVGPRGESFRCSGLAVGGSSGESFGCSGVALGGPGPVPLPNIFFPHFAF